MDSVEKLLNEYIAEHQSGDAADPVEYVKRVEPARRRELAALIDGYLARAPRPPSAQRPRSDPRSEATIEALSRSIGGEAGLWPALLPRLRDRAGLKRRELVEQLASMLGVSDRRAKVELYYHEMELGTLAADGVSDRVLDALSKLVGTTVSELRAAGAALGEGAGSGAQTAAFARLVSTDAPPSLAVADAPSGAEEQWDEVDELFRAGD